MSEELKLPGMSKSDRESILGGVLFVAGSALLWYLQGALVAISVMAMIGGSILMFANGAMKDYMDEKNHTTEGEK